MPTHTKRHSGLEPGGRVSPPAPGRAPPDVPRFLRRLFEAWEAAGIRYAALRTGPELPDSGRELDIVVAPAGLRAMLSEMRSLCVRFPALRIAYWRELPRHGASVVLAWQADDVGWDRLYFDIRCGLYKRGHLLLDGSRLDDRNTVRDEHLGLRRPTDALECALLLVRNAIDRRERKARHDWILANRWSDEVPDHVRRLGFDYEAVTRGQPQLDGSPGFTYHARRLRYGFNALYGRLRCRGPGMNIVLYGPDGVGKSTQADRIAGFFRGLGIRGGRVRVYHAFTDVARLSERKRSRGSAMKRRTYRRARRPYTRLPLLTAAYLKRLIVLNAWLLPRVRRGAILVHDRYLLDVFTKSLKVHGESRGTVARALARVSPGGDSVFLLRADPEVVSSRTGELSPTDVVALYELLDACLLAAYARRGGVEEIDASRDVDEVHRAVIDRILEIQTRRLLEDHRGRAEPPSRSKDDEPVAS